MLAHRSCFTATRPCQSIATIALLSFLALSSASAGRPRLASVPFEKHEQAPRNLCRALPARANPPTSVRTPPVVRDIFKSVQVNVDAFGRNIAGDAANEPSIAIDPNDPNKIVIGWRQFDTVDSDFRQAGWAYSHDGGETWTFPGSVLPGVFGSDPVLSVDSDGAFYYLSIDFPESRLFKSFDGGKTWGQQSQVTNYLLDKPWMAIDRTIGPGRGNIYIVGWPTVLFRSADGGLTFPVIHDDVIFRGTLDVGPDGTLYAVGGSRSFTYSANAWDLNAETVFTPHQQVDMGGTSFARCTGATGQLVTQPWVISDHSQGPTHGNVYLLNSLDPDDSEDQCDLMFVRSTDGGETWGAPVRINDDEPHPHAAQWFSTLAVAPNGRIDVAWNDTRNFRGQTVSELYYSYSMDGGQTWSPNIVVSPPFEASIGFPLGSPKLGDYYHMVSTNEAALLAYAATFHGEQDVYFVRIAPFDCNQDGMLDADQIAQGAGTDCNDDGFLDACERDCDGNGVPDECDIRDGLVIDADENGIPDEAQGRLYVDAEATGKNDGSTWHDAFIDLQDALEAASGVDACIGEIWVARGTYRPDRGTGNRYASFHLASNVKIYGGFATSESDPSQRNASANPTILSGDLLMDDLPELVNRSDNSLSVVSGYFLDNSVIDGVTIASGYAMIRGHYNNIKESGGNLKLLRAHVTLRDCDIRDGYSEYIGGGLYAEHTALTIENCRFAHNSAYDMANATWWSEVNVTDSYFSEGGRTAFGAVAGRSTWEGCVFEDNVGDSVLLVGSPLGDMASRVSRCIFRGGQSRYEAIATGGTTVISESSFTDNEGLNISCRGRDLLSFGQVTVRNSLFAGNKGRGGGWKGLFRGVFCNARIENCTIVHNEMSNSPVVISERGSNVEIHNSILWGNTDSKGQRLLNPVGTEDRDYGVTASISVDHSCIDGSLSPATGSNNSFIDPLFSDTFGPDRTPGTGDEDYTLRADSPLINRGDPGFQPVENETDLAGDPRPQGCRVDIGAYESDVAQRVFDFDNSNRIDLRDFADLQTCWSASTAAPSWVVACKCVFDENQSGAIDYADLTELIGLFEGPAAGN